MTLNQAITTVLKRVGLSTAAGELQDQARLYLGMVVAEVAPAPAAVAPAPAPVKLSASISIAFAVVIAPHSILRAPFAVSVVSIDTASESPS